jgi:hypothetical protein
VGTDGNRWEPQARASCPAQVKLRRRSPIEETTHVKHKLLQRSKVLHVAGLAPVVSTFEKDQPHSTPLLVLRLTAVEN